MSEMAMKKGLNSWTTGSKSIRWSRWSTAALRWRGRCVVVKWRGSHSRDERKIMKEPGLDNRHRDKKPPKSDEIQQKRSDALNKNLSKPIPEFSPNATLGTMRKETSKISIAAVRRAAERLRP